MDGVDTTGKKQVLKRLRLWHCMPTTVVLLTALSLGMLIWVDHLDQRQGRHFAFINALQTLRLRMATSHLWLEELFAHDYTIDIETVWGDVRAATRIAGALLEGGPSEAGAIIEPLKDPALRERVEEIRRLIGAWERTAHERYRYWTAMGGNTTGHLEERCDDLFAQMQRHAEGLEQILHRNQAADFGRSRRLFVGIILAWAFIGVASTTGLVRREERRRRAEEALRDAHDQLEARVADRTQELERAVKVVNRELGERKKTEVALRQSETQLRHLSGRLLTVQEEEQRRIAAELHDELGHALVVLKIRLKLVRGECASGDCNGGCSAVNLVARQQCEELSKYIDQVIEDVRRLSRDLSPSVLEDLGLCSALRWLVDNSVGNGGGEMVSDIVDIDHLFSPKAQVLVYRIVQEALTNVRKHAGAHKVSLSIERHDDRVSFVVEDDGVGFDTEGATMRDACDKGLGLTTMRERAWMLGATLEVASERGKGTRVSLSAPVGDGARL
jgi:signal transduction histidine kinase